MNQPIKRNLPDQEPMTVGHGRKIYDQSRAIAVEVEKLHPLLALVEEREIAPETDPIAKIVELLTKICKEQQVQHELQKSLQRKIDSIAARLDTGGPSTNSAK